MTQKTQKPWADQAPPYRQALGLSVLDPEVQAFQAEVAQVMRETEAYRIAENYARENFRAGYILSARAETGRLGRIFNQHVRKAENNLTKDIESGALMLDYVDGILRQQLATTEKEMKSPVQSTADEGAKDHAALLKLRDIVLDRLSEKPATQEAALKRMSLPPTRHW